MVLISASRSFPPPGWLQKFFKWFVLAHDVSGVEWPVVAALACMCDTDRQIVLCYTDVLSSHRDLKLPLLCVSVCVCEPVIAILQQHSSQTLNTTMSYECVDTIYNCIKPPLLMVPDGIFGVIHVWYYCHLGVRIRRIYRHYATSFHVGIK